jgi:hypothetical protein
MGRGASKNESVIDLDDIQRVGFDASDERQLAIDRARWKEVFRALSINLASANPDSARLKPFDHPDIWKALSEAGSDKETNYFYEDLIGYLYGDVSNGSLTPVMELSEGLGFSEAGEEWALDDFPLLREAARPYITKRLKAFKADPSSLSTDEAWEEFVDSIKDHLLVEGISLAVDRLLSLEPEVRIRLLLHMDDENFNSDPNREVALDIERAFLKAHVSLEDVEWSHITREQIIKTLKKTLLSHFPESLLELYVTGEMMYILSPEAYQQFLADSAGKEGRHKDLINYLAGGH